MFSALDLGIGIGGGGGLSAETMYRAEPLLGEFPFFSIDAESGLRDGDDRLDSEKVKRYIAEALRCVQKNK